MIDLLPTYHVIKISGDVPYTLKVQINSQGSPLNLSMIQEIECFIGDPTISVPNLKMSQGDISVGDTENTLFIQAPSFDNYFSSNELPTTLEFSIVMTDTANQDLLISQGLFYIT